MSDEPPNEQDPTLQGTTPDVHAPRRRQAAINDAFDYRGDVTITLDDGNVVEGYVFDRREDVTDPFLRVLPGAGGQAVVIRYNQIASLAFTGRDTAAGKSWQTWVEQYEQKKASGESASLEPEALD